MAPSREPQNVDKQTWYYEYKGSVLVVREVRSTLGNYLVTEQFRIPWRLLEKSMKRCRSRKMKLQQKGAAS
jgi:hypothetical protein